MKRKKGMEFINPTTSAPVPMLLPSQKRKKETPPFVPFEGNPLLRGLVIPEQQQHAEYERKTNHYGRRRATNVTECNLDVYLHRGNLNGDKSLGRKEQIAQGQARHAAGLRLYRDFYASRMVGGFKSCLNVTIGGRGGVNKAGLNFQAYEAYQAARDAIHIHYRKITLAVCCIGEWLGDVETSVPVYRRMDSLVRGLDALIEHYEGRINPGRVMASFNASLTTTMGDI